MPLNSGLFWPIKMEKFWILILVSFFATNSLDKAESVQLEETPLEIIDEIFGEGWWNNDKDEEWNKLTIEQNAIHQIDRQNTQIGQIEPNSTDQNPPLTESDHFGQIEPNSNDQNPTLTESDHSDNAKNGEEQSQVMNEMTSNKNIVEVERKRKIVVEFDAKIYKWKKEFGLSKRNPKNERKNLIEKFDQMKAELKLAGFKSSYKNELDETVAKELGLSFVTIYNWKREFNQTEPNKYAHNEQKELMKLYYEIKDQKPKISNENIAKILKIGTTTLYRWKKQFERQELHPNSVDGHSVEENAVANVQEIGNSNSRSI